MEIVFQQERKEKNYCRKPRENIRRKDKERNKGKNELDKVPYFSSLISRSHTRNNETTHRSEMKLFRAERLGVLRIRLIYFFEEKFWLTS